MTNSEPFKMCSHRREEREGESRLKPLKYSGQYSRRTTADGSLQSLPNPKGQHRRLTATKERERGDDASRRHEVRRWRKIPASVFSNERLARCRVMSKKSKDRLRDPAL